MSIANKPPGPASAGMFMQANGSLPVIPLYFPVPPVMIWVPQSIFGCDLSRSRVSKVEKILSPSLSASTQAPSMYFLSPDATFSATHCADILSSIFSPFIFCVVPPASKPPNKVWGRGAPSHVLQSPRAIDRHSPGLGEGL